MAGYNLSTPPLPCSRKPCCHARFCRQCFSRALRQWGIDDAEYLKEVSRAYHTSKVQERRRRLRLLFPPRPRGSIARLTPSERRQRKYQAVQRSKAKNRQHYRMLDVVNKARRRANGGDLTLAQWEQMKQLYDHRCAYCQKKMRRLTMDHVIPIINGGKTTWENIVPACKRCNSRKHTKAAPLHQMIFKLL